MNSIVRQVDPADLSSIDESPLCHLCDVVVLQIQVVGPKWDGRDHADVPVLTVEGVWVAGVACALSGTVRKCRGRPQNDRGELCGLLGLRLCRRTGLGHGGLLGSWWTFRGFLSSISLGGHISHQEEQNQCRDESRAGLHGPTAGRERNIQRPSTHAPFALLPTTNIPCEGDA